MLMIDAPFTPANQQLDYPAANEELNRMLCAAVVSNSFRSMLLSNPEIAVAAGYQGEKFDLSHEDQTWLFTTRPTSLVDLAAGMVAYQHENKVKLPVDPTPHKVRVN